MADVLQVLMQKNKESFHLINAFALNDHLKDGWGNQGYDDDNVHGNWYFNIYQLNKHGSDFERDF